LRRNLQGAPLRRAVAQDVADDLLEDKLNVVARTRGRRQIVGVECLAQFIEGLFKAGERPDKPEPNRVRVDATSFR
jgi:hypothetical protein